MTMEKERLLTSMSSLSWIGFGAAETIEEAAAMVKRILERCILKKLVGDCLACL